MFGKKKPPAVKPDRLVQDGEKIARAVSGKLDIALKRKMSLTDSPQDQLRWDRVSMFRETLVASDNPEAVLLQLQQELGVAFGAAIGVRDAAHMLKCCFNTYAALHGVAGQSSMTDAMLKAQGATPPEIKQIVKSVGNDSLAEIMGRQDAATRGMIHDEVGAKAGFEFESERGQTYVDTIGLFVEQWLGALEAGKISAPGPIHDLMPQVVAQLRDLAEKTSLRLCTVTAYQAAANTASAWLALAIETAEDAVDTCDVLPVKSGTEALASMMSSLFVQLCAEAMGHPHGDTNFKPEHFAKAKEKLHSVFKMAEAGIRAREPEAKADTKPTLQ